MRYLFLPFFLLAFIGTASAQFANNSVLADGEIYKLEIVEDGVYKITFSFLGNNGINPALVNPNNVKIYGQLGGMLPQRNAEERVDDLEELPLHVVGGSDGSFDADDYILFYAQGPNSYKYDADKERFSHEVNVYADANYYFLKLNASTTSLRIAEQANDITNGTTVGSFNDFTYQEPEINNVLESGREWYGKEYRFTLAESFDFEMTGILPSSTIYVEASVMTKSTDESSFTFQLNGQNLGNVESEITPISTYGIQGQTNVSELSIVNSGLNTDAGITIDLTYNQPNSNAKGYLDYLLINAERELNLYNNQTIFSIYC